MSILINESTTFIVQGITGREADLGWIGLAEFLPELHAELGEQ